MVNRQSLRSHREDKGACVGKSEAREDVSRILLVDDHKLLMEGVRSLLKPYTHLHVAGMAHSGSEAVSLATSLAPHIMILDLNMPGMNGVETGRVVLQFQPSTRIVIYTGDEEQRYLPELIDIGITGHVRKSDSPQTLLAAVESARRGEVYLSFPDPGGRVASLLKNTGKTNGMRKSDNFATLSPREREIFGLLIDGQNMKAIAKTLSISPRTAETHKYNIFTKLHAESMVDLMKIAIRNGHINL